MTTPAPGKGGRDQHSATTTKADRDATATDPQSVPTQLRRRRAAAWRCEPLVSGLRDPLDPAGEPLTDAELASWRVAWLHLAELDLPAIVPPRVLVAAGRWSR